jgi:hypothetical protein
MTLEGEFEIAFVSGVSVQRDMTIYGKQKQKQHQNDTSMLWILFLCCCCKENCSSNF